MLKINPKTLYAAIKQLPKREKMIFYTAVFFAALIFLERMIVSPVYSKMTALDKELKVNESGISQNLRILAQKDKIIVLKNKYSSYLDNFVSEEIEVSSLLKEIEMLASKASVYLVDMKPAGTKEAGASKKTMINLECEAQMEQIVDFMYHLENSDKLLIIEKYQITPKSKESTVARCSMVIAKVFIP